MVDYPEHPYVLEIPTEGVNYNTERDRYQLCSLCIIFVCQEVERKMRVDHGGSFVVRGAIEVVRESFKRGQQRLRPQKK